MRPIQGEVRDGKLVLIIDVSEAAIKDAELSQSGKSRVVASTHGFTGYGNVKVSLNVTAPK